VVEVLDRLGPIPEEPGPGPGGGGGGVEEVDRLWLIPEGRAVSMLMSWLVLGVKGRDGPLGEGAWVVGGVKERSESRLERSPVECKCRASCPKTAFWLTSLTIPGL
jgi:hypothetical protein